MKIGPVRIAHSITLAPMEEHTNFPFRLPMKQFGAALACTEPQAVERIGAAVVPAVSIPVTLKIRTGPDARRETAIEVTRRAEQVGAAAVDLHARSVAQAYVGGPDWSVVGRVKREVQIPVMGSGGIRAPQDAVRYLNESGADAVAIGRGCLGNPSIFRQARSLVQGGGRRAGADGGGTRARALGTG